MGGKASPPPPDYSGLEALSREQLAFSKQQYADILPIAQQVAARQMEAQQQQMGLAAEQSALARSVAEQQMEAQRQQMRQAQDYYQYQQETFRPVERGLVADAQRFNTEAYREQLAAQAAAAASQAFGQTQAMSQRAMAARGVNPNSPAGVALAQQANLGLAAQRAGAMTGARQQAEQLGWARRMDVTGLGRGLAGASLGAYQGATGAGQAAGGALGTAAGLYGGSAGAGSAGIGSLMAPGNQFTQGMGQAGQTMGTITGQQASTYNAAMQQSDPFGTILGMGLGGWASGGFKGLSDRRLKENIELVGRDERTGLNLYEFEYKGGSGRRFAGVMADEVLDVMPEAVYQMPDGFYAVRYDMLGFEMKEVANG